MKQSGLKHRFNPIDTEVWMFHYPCMWCGKNRWDCLHHIISPSSHDYKLEDFNASILNSSPMHNSGCHLDNGELHHQEVEINLLEKTMTVLFYNHYKLNDVDKLFIKTYWNSHFSHFKNLLTINDHKRLSKTP